MSQLRETLLDTQREKTLFELFGDKSKELTKEQRDHYLGVLGNQIENDVDKMLHNHVVTFNENTPVKKKGKKLRFVYIASNIILNVAIAYAVNIESWIFVSFLMVLLLVNQYLPFIYEE